MKTHHTLMNTFRSILIAGMVASLAQPLSAAGTSPQPAAKKEAKQSSESPSQMLYKQGMAAVESEDYRQAFEHFAEAGRLEPDSPDILNMMAYSQRKMGNLAEAFRYYQQALDLRPRFPEAREYLGEAHIQAALEQIRILESYGPEAAHELEELREALRKAADASPE